MTTTARVTLTLDIDTDGTWGDDYKMSQVRDQAISEALGCINRLIQQRHIKARIVGKPIVDIVMHQPKQKR